MHMLNGSPKRSFHTAAVPTYETKCASKGLPNAEGRARKWPLSALFLFGAISLLPGSLVADSLAFDDDGASAPGSSASGYYATEDDDYSCSPLRAHLAADGVGTLTHVSAKAIAACQRIQRLAVSGLRLTDDHNATVLADGPRARVDVTHPSTLFAPYAMTMDPDVGPEKRIGWPLRSRSVQQRGFDAVNARQPGCIEYPSDGERRRSPYTSHCSAYVAWVALEVFGVNLMPTRVGDWCHVAAEQRNRMRADGAHWRRVDAVAAQRAANAGALVVAARQTSPAASEANQFNGHIAIVLPKVAAIASALQRGANYPVEPVVGDEATFEQFLRLYGPEIAQAGGLNFAHTQTANGFARHYGAGATPGVTPVDEQVEFYVYLSPTRIN